MTTKPVPIPTETIMKKRWRWDRFATEADVAEWIRLRTADGFGYAIHQRGLWVAWDQAVRPRQQKIVYPKQRFEWCNHCGERRTFERQGSGTYVNPTRRPGQRRKDYPTLQRRDYTYTEIPGPHSCPGFDAERLALQRSTASLSALFNRMLRGKKR